MLHPYESALIIAAQIGEQRRQKNVKLKALSAPCRRKLLSQHQNRRAFDGDTGQVSCVPRSSVDIYSIVTNIGMLHRRVTVNDEFSVVACRIEEFVTNPEQIVPRLLFHRDGGTDAGVNKQEIAATKAVVETLQE
jgi:hypothetical protein